VTPLLRVLFARSGDLIEPSTGELVRAWTHDAIVGALLALPAGSRLTLEAPVLPAEGARLRDLLDVIARAGFSRVRLGGQQLRVEEVPQDADPSDLAVVVDRIKVEAARADRLYDAVRTASAAGRGVIVARTDDGERVFADRPFSLSVRRELPALEPSLLDPSRSKARCTSCAGAGCDACEGTGLGQVPLAVRFGGLSVAQALSASLSALPALLAAAPRDAVSQPVLDELARRCERLERLGLGALPLLRPLGQVSSSERQRARLARQVSARLSGVLYVLDEPAAGLDDATGERVVAELRDLQAQGNTVVVVEHHPVILRAADRVLEFGPGAGAHGGALLFDGTPADLVRADTATGRALRGELPLPSSHGAKASGVVRVSTAAGEHSLGLGQLVLIEGPSASGKSALLRAAVAAVQLGEERIIVEVEAGGVRRSARSIPATYVGLWDVLRELLAATQDAQVRGLRAADFSLNQKGGRCEACRGTGQHAVSLELLPDVLIPCAVCEGRRFSVDLCTVRWKGLGPHELLDLEAEDALRLLAGHPRLERPLRRLVDVGLGYVALGQPTQTLSGGEAQRLRLARELAKGQTEGRLYALDEPTLGLHPIDVNVLARALQRVVQEGATVWVASSDKRLLAAADAVVSLDTPPRGKT